MNLVFSEITFRFDRSVYIIAFAFVSLLVIIFWIKKYRTNKKIKKIIASYQHKKKSESKTSDENKSSSHTENWGINNSPYRERKSGLTWSGGNIKGSTAKRGTRRKFLS